MSETKPEHPRRNSESSAPEVQEAAEIPRFSPEEEAALLKDSNTQKLQANALFSSSRYTEAIQEYDKALSSCPNYLDYEIAVLRSNISACHLKLEDWKGAVTAATEALDALDRLDPRPATDNDKNKNKDDPKQGDATKNAKDAKDKRPKLDPNVSGIVEELSDEDEDDGTEEKNVQDASTTKEPTSSVPTALERSGKSREDVDRIRAKALMRRAKGKSEEGGWGNLAGAEEDYKQLASMAWLPPADKKIVRQALGTLPARIEEAKSKEMGEMFSKLKQLGNGILKPFGLSTDNFKMVKDEATGGYSMNFEQNR